MVSSRAPALLVASLLAFVAGCDGAGGLLVVKSTAVDGGSGPPVNDLVNGGTVATSPKYKVVYTFGQSSPGQSVSKSSNDRNNGGVVGAMNGP